MLNTTACLALSLVAQTPTAPAPALPPLIQWKVTGASLFKNGYGVVFREASIPSGKSVFHAPVPGMASLGTLWFTGSKDLKIQRIATTNRVNKVTYAASSIPEILGMNVGSTITLEVLRPGAAASDKLEAKVKELLPKHVVVLAKGEERIIPLEAIRSLASPKGLKLKRDAATTDQALEFRVSGPSGSKLYSMAIQNGISWSPAYAVQLLDDTKLRLTGQATLINNLAELKGADVKLVTGFPSLAFLYQPDPLTVGFLGPMTTGGMGGGMGGFGGGAQMQNAAPREAGRANFDAAMGEAFSPGGEGFAAEDLFFYKLPDTSLMFGGRSQTILFEGTADYKAVYRAELPDPISQASSRDLPPPDVWHTLVFKNPIAQPLTTAPAITMKSGEVIGQNELKYASQGGPVSLKVGKALDVVLEATAEEVEREPGVRKDRHGNPTYDLITLKGVVQAENLKSKDVQLEVAIPLEGEVVAAPGADVTRTAAGLRDVNPRSLVSWKPLVKKGEKAKLEYTVKILVTAR